MSKDYYVKTLDCVQTSTSLKSGLERILRHLGIRKVDIRESWAVAIVQRYQVAIEELEVRTLNTKTNILWFGLDVNNLHKYGLVPYVKVKVVAYYSKYPKKFYSSEGILTSKLVFEDSFDISRRRLVQCLRSVCERKNVNDKLELQDHAFLTMHLLALKIALSKTPKFSSDISLWGGWGESDGFLIPEL